MTPLLTLDAYLDALRNEVKLATDAALFEPLAPVPSLPGWNAVSTLAHIAQNIATRACDIEDGAPHEPVPPPPPTDDWFFRIGEWAEHATEAFARAAGDARDRTDIENLTGRDRTSRFWARILLHETSVHRWDIQSAVGTATPLPYATDAVDEWLTVILPSWIVPRRGRVNAPGLGVSASDTTYASAVMVADGEVAACADPDVTVRARASELALWLCGRVPDDEMRIDGDVNALGAWRELRRYAY